MKRITMSILLAFSTLLASDIKVENPYVRATPPNLPTSAAFMNVINNSDKAVSIVKASSNVSKVVELHTHDMKDGVMKMYQVPKIDVASNGHTELKPGGFHIMLIGLKKPLKVGENVSLTLEFSNGSTKTITAPVKKVMAGMKHHSGHMKHHNH